MGAIIDFFTGLIDTVVALVDFVIQNVQDLVYLVSLLGSLLPQIPIFLSWLPSVFVSIIVFAFTIVLILKIVGREG